MPAGDIGVGGREVGYMAGMYKKLSNRADCVFTGKGLSYGGSLIRPEATGYGTVYFAEEMLKTRGRSFDGLRVSVSGSGNVAQFAVQKAISLGAKVITVSDSSGTVIDNDGFTPEKLAVLMEVKNHRFGRVSDYAKQVKLTFEAGVRPLPRLKRSMLWWSCCRTWSACTRWAWKIASRSCVIGSRSRLSRCSISTL